MKVRVTFRDASGRYMTEIYPNAEVKMEGSFVHIANEGGFHIITADRLIELRAIKDDNV